MKVVFTESFWKSLKIMARHQTWWYRTYEVFRYKLPAFFRNLYYYRRELWEFRGWDYSFNLTLFARSLEKTSEVLEKHGNEVEVSKNKKVEKIKRVIELIKNSREDHYIYRAEEELGEIRGENWFLGDDELNPEDMEHNRKVYARAREIEEIEWSEIWDILRGQNIDEYRTLMGKLPPEEKDKMDVWNDWYDGSGIRNWWD
jgi:hypothetical protein